MHGIALALIRTYRGPQPQAPKTLIIISCARTSRKALGYRGIGPTHFFSRDSIDSRTSCFTFRRHSASGTLLASAPAAR